MLLAAARPAQAQDADITASLVTTTTPACTVIADARCFTARGDVLGHACPGPFIWTLERCDETGCVPREFRISPAYPHRVTFRPTKRGLYRLRMWAPYLFAETSVRLGPLPL